MEYYISTDKSRLDIAAIHNYLCNRSYWARGRKLDAVKRSIKHSICFGLYNKEDTMVGFARAVTDQTAFAYLMDVFILEDWRGRGLGKMLVKHVIEHPDLQVRLWLLGTLDAHDMYRKLGFAPLLEPGRFMAMVDESRC